MTKIFITGALGHIGSRFIHDIRPGQYDEVVLLDNLSTQRYVSLFNLPDGVPFRFVEGDICVADLEKLFEGMDVVVHLAGITDAANSFEIRELVERVNFEGTRRVAQACAARGCRLIFLSTTSVYGTQQDVVDENLPPGELKPQSPYADSKLRAEEAIRALGESDGLRYIICRFGTIFGTSSGMRFHTAINKFVWQACLGQPITVWRTALNQKRPYLELGDAVRAIRLIVAGDHFPNRVFNVLTLNATVGEIVEVIRAFVPDVRIKFVDERIMNQLSYEVLCDRFKALGFVFEGDLRRSIGESVALLRNVRA